MAEIIKPAIPKMEKKTILLIILLIIVIVIFVLVFVIPKKLSTIAECKNLECVKKFALLTDFNPEDCKNAPERFRNDCYYIFEVENNQAEREVRGKYCALIDSGDYETDCFYKSNGAIILTGSSVEKMVNAVTNLDTIECDKLSVPPLKEECVNYVNLAKEALEKNDPSLCQGSIDSYIPSQVQMACFGLFEGTEKPE